LFIHAGLLAFLPLESGRIHHTKGWQFFKKENDALDIFKNPQTFKIIWHWKRDKNSVHKTF